MNKTVPMLDYHNTMIVPQSSDINSRADVDLVRYFQTAGAGFETIPIIAANMVNIGTQKVAEHMWYDNSCMTALQKGLTFDFSQCPDMTDDPVPVWHTFGMKEDIPSDTYDFILLDVANGYMENFLRRVERVVEENPYAFIMAGNVVTYDGARRLFDVGVDVVKVGIGSGAQCTTRIKTGVGMPQLSAVIDCARAAREYEGYVCSDGGHRVPGDVAKSFAAGADFVMLGTMLAGTKETGRHIYGNASVDAQGIIPYYKTAEGIRTEIDRECSLDDVMQDILGGLASACSYVGARNLVQFKELAELIKVD